MKLNEIKLTPLLDTLHLEKISDSVYFSKKYSNYISNSRLGLLYDDVEQFFKGIKQSGFNPSFVLGTAVHSICLQPEFFELGDDLEKPTAKMGAMADELYPLFIRGKITKDDVINASNIVDYYKGKMDKKKIDNVLSSCLNYWKLRSEREINPTDKEILYLDSKTLNTAKACINSIQENKYIQKLLKPEGLIQEPIIGNELAVLMDVKAECPNGQSVILKLKSKVDNFTIDLDREILTVNDIKTIGKFLNELDTNIEKYKYNRELGMYTYLMKLCAQKFYGLENPEIRANYLAVSTIPEYYSKVRPISLIEIRKGFNEFKTLLKYVAYLMCYKEYRFYENNGI